MAWVKEMSAKTVGSRHVVKAPLTASDDRSGVRQREDEGALG